MSRYFFYGLTALVLTFAALLADGRSGNANSDLSLSIGEDPEEIREKQEEIIEAQEEIRE